MASSDRARNNDSKITGTSQHGRPLRGVIEEQQFSRLERADRLSGCITPLADNGRQQPGNRAGWAAIGQNENATTADADETLDQIDIARAQTVRSSDDDGVLNLQQNRGPG